MSDILKLQINKECFDAIKSGEQKVEHRWIYSSNLGVYLQPTNEGGEICVLHIDEGEDANDKTEKDLVRFSFEGQGFVPRKYKFLELINGRRKDAPRLRVEVLGVRFVVFQDKENNVYVDENDRELMQVWYNLGKIQ